MKVGRLTLSEHARERIRQRVGLIADYAALAWVADVIKNAKQQRRDGRKVHYITDLFEVIVDGVTVVTVKPTENTNGYITKFNEMLTKESRKLIATYRRELRKAEIAVAEAQLNYLKARNPKTRESIGARLTSAIDHKALITDKIKAVEIAAKRFGVTVE
ncbi:hypothetical protein [Robertmurraya andreesenii]|uniref:Uncharacterized protein n=1 Tax=Anoxybacillus andreesenii TaxID=1325932 RepID=A0ABT9V275_9BACL|nr:hypothetical protein [Robertmurraya andreesenii]MDQ0154965.1 hypothetical protein [Robertmurraya andreesenii]